MNPTPVIYTDGRTVQFVTRVSQSDAMLILDILRDLPATLRREYGQALYKALCRSTGAESIDCKKLSPAGLVIASHRLKAGAAKMFALACSDERPIDSFIASLERIERGTAFMTEIPYLAIEGIHRR